MLASSWQAGDLTWPERLRSALLLNIRLYLLMALGLVVFVIYLVIRWVQRLHVWIDEYIDELIDRVMDGKIYRWAGEFR